MLDRRLAGRQLFPSYIQIKYCAKAAIELVWSMTDFGGSPVRSCILIFHIGMPHVVKGWEQVGCRHELNILWNISLGGVGTPLGRIFITVGYNDGNTNVIFLPCTLVTSPSMLSPILSSNTSTLCAQFWRRSHPKSQNCC